MCQYSKRNNNVQQNSVKLINQRWVGCPAKAGLENRVIMVRFFDTIVNDLAKGVEVAIELIVQEELLEPSQLGIAEGLISG